MHAIQRRRCTISYMTKVESRADVPQKNKSIRITQMHAIQRRECTISYMTKVESRADV